VSTAVAVVATTVAKPEPCFASAAAQLEPKFGGGLGCWQGNVNAFLSTKLPNARSPF